MISVVIPVYNSGNYLVKAIRSVLSQGVCMEIIIVDDCSTDSCVISFIKWIKENYKVHASGCGDDCLADNGSGDDVSVANVTEAEGASINDLDGICSLYWAGNISVAYSDGKENIIRCRIYRNSVNQGVAKTRNTAVSLSEGDYIAFLDSDDWWAEGKLKRQLRLMERTGAVLCNTAREVMKPNGSSTGLIIETPHRIGIKQLKRTNYINCSSVLVKREAVLKYPMEHSDAQEDYLTWLRILAEYGEAVGINVPLMKYRLTVGGKSRNKLKSAVMTYKTYCYAGYGRIRSAFMMIAYTYNGLKKYIG